MQRSSLLSILFLFITNVSIAGSIDSKIKDVTVYRQYARINRTAVVNFEQGTSEIVLGNLSSNIISTSIQATVKGSAALLSLNHRINYLESQERPALVKALKDSLTLIQNDLKWINSQKTAYQGEEQLINLNTKLGSNEEGMTVAELQNLTKFYHERVLEIKKKIFDLDNEAIELNVIRMRLEAQLNDINANYRVKPTGEIVLQLSANVSGKATVSFSYLIHSAGWTPIYDIRYVGIDKAMNLVYKANVFQTSGYDWNDVSLTISNGNPAQNNERPILNPLYVDFYTGQIAYKGKRSDQPQANMAYAEADYLQVIQEDVYSDDEAPAYTVNVNENQMTTEYAIDLKQSIASDGKFHLVAITDYDLDAKYQYHSVPRLDKGAFLLGKVYDFGKYHLLSGMASIFFEDMYIGQSMINPNVSSDTLLISLGQDNNINIQRNQLNDLTSTKLIGANKKQTYAYEIIVKNNKNKAVGIEILDAIPISRNSEIEVELIESSGAEFIKEYGKLSWNLNLAAGESKKLSFTYSIKYPKNQIINEF
jgi:uncharacterized protein (TIGR02231 family)